MCRRIESDESIRIDSNRFSGVNRIESKLFLANRNPLITTYSSVQFMANFLGKFGAVLRHCICSLRCRVSPEPSAVSVDPEAVRIWGACDGNEDPDGSGRDDPQTARGTRSSA